MVNDTPSWQWTVTIIINNEGNASLTSVMWLSIVIDIHSMNPMSIFHLSLLITPVGIKFETDTNWICILLMCHVDYESVPSIAIHFIQFLFNRSLDHFHLFQRRPPLLLVWLPYFCYLCGCGTWITGHNPTVTLSVRSQSNGWCCSSLLSLPLVCCSSAKKTNGLL